jgi:hypothetical protein
MVRMADPSTTWRELARHERAMATVRWFGEQAGASRMAVLVDGGDGTVGAMLEWERGSSLAASAGDETFVVPDEALAAAPRLAVAAPRAVPATAIDVDAAAGQVAAPLGAVAGLADALLELAGALGGRSVATAEFETTSEPLTIAARVGEPVVLAVGDAQFELPQ